MIVRLLTEHHLEFLSLNKFSNNSPCHIIICWVLVHPRNTGSNIVPTWQNKNVDMGVKHQRKQTTKLRLVTVSVFMRYFYKLEDLKVLMRSPDLLNNVKIGQGQLQLITEKILFYHMWGLQAFWSRDLNNLMNNPSNSPVISEKQMFR